MRVVCVPLGSGSAGRRTNSQPASSKSSTSKQSAVSTWAPPAASAAPPAPPVGSGTVMRSSPPEHTSTSIKQGLPVPILLDLGRPNTLGISNAGTSRNVATSAGIRLWMRRVGARRGGRGGRRRAQVEGGAEEDVDVGGEPLERGEGRPRRAPPKRYQPDAADARQIQPGSAWQAVLTDAAAGGDVLALQETLQVADLEVHDGDALQRARGQRAARRAHRAAAAPQARAAVTSLEEQITVGGEKSSSGDDEPKDEALADLPPGGLTTSHINEKPCDALKNRRWLSIVLRKIPKVGGAEEISPRALEVLKPALYKD
ncbi:hypothetical protein MSG28_003743 [Choristoneura fumiferana]|uniref:Uncharacterized protein n=1 Tax=Choristoneura fumiferana TaxID=7141 RepID=A0ACC0KH93_CHOFU|nr:hypothetical protein MSG28_003743 [Choristoneura fumiferana]